MAATSGTPGADSLAGGNGADTLLGLAGNDRLIGRDGADRLFGGEDNDLLIGGGGNDRLDGGAGFDVASYEQVDVGVRVDLVAGRASRDGDGGADLLTGIEELRGSAFADVLALATGDEQARGGGGADTLLGREGDDQLRPGSGNDRLDGGEGSGDEASYLDDGRDPRGAGTRGILVDLAAGTATDNWNGRDRLAGIEHIHGSTLADSISGSEADNKLRGEAGDDVLIGLDGSDQLDGGAGNDTLDGGEGADTLRFKDATAGVAVDLVQGLAVGSATGTDRLLGIENVEDTAFADLLVGDGGRNRFRMSARGGDSIDGAGGDDEVDYSAATRALAVTLGDGLVRLGGGREDRLSGVEQIVGSAFADRLTGSAGEANELFQGLAGDDRLDGGGGSGRRGVSYSQSPAGVVVDLDAGTAEDGWGAVDSLIGIDEAQGSAFRDVLRGSDADERFVARAGNDRIDGRGGIDRIAYGSDGGPQGVTVDLAAGTAIDSWGDTDRLARIEEVESTDLDDTLIGSAGDDLLRPRAGDDVVHGGQGFDRLEFGTTVAGVVVDLAAGTARDGNGGVDLLRSIEAIRGTTLADRLVGSARAELLEGGNGDDRLAGGEGNDSLRGESGVDRLAGDAGDDSLRGGEGNDLQSGGAGDDHVDGEDGNDALSGGAGIDTVDGGAGRDRLSGGQGNDLFVVDDIAAGSDHIVDFRRGDVIDLHKLVDDFGSKDDPADFARLAEVAGDTRLLLDADGGADGFRLAVILDGVVGLDLAKLVDSGGLLLD